MSWGEIEGEKRIVVLIIVVYNYNSLLLSSSWITIVSTITPYKVKNTIPLCNHFGWISTTKLILYFPRWDALWPKSSSSRTTDFIIIKSTSYKHLAALKMSPFRLISTLYLMQKSHLFNCKSTRNQAIKT